MDVSKIKPGDTVTVRGVVKRRHDDGDFIVAFSFSGGGGKVISAEKDFAGGEFVHHSAIVSHEPRALQVGDRVRTQFGFTGNIVAQHKGASWVLCNGHVYGTYVTADLERIDA